MAHLADDTSAALRIARVPVFRGEPTRKDAVGGGLRTRGCGQPAVQLDAGRREASIEADLETTLALEDGCVDLLEFLFCQAKGLFDEHVAIREQRSLDQGPVQVVAR